MANQIQPSIGRIVHYVNVKGVVEPAIITRVWTRECVNLQVLADCAMPYVQTSSIYSEDGQAYTWHWPERV